jgi:hypothetical protein
MEQETGDNAKHWVEADAATYGWYKFTLRANESLTIQGLPAGMVYYLYEEDYSNDGYTTYFKTLAAGSAEGTLTTPTEDSFMKNANDEKDPEANISNGGQNVLSQYKNGAYFLNKIDIPTETGIALDIMPYVAVVLAVAVVCVALLVYKKRRMAR